MADNSSLYGTGGSNAGVSSSNFTTLYSGGGGKLPGGDNVIINGTLTVNGCSILTDCTAFNLLPFNATTVNAFGAATALQLGDTTGVTTIQNQLATANYAFPLADGVSGQVLITNGSGQLSFAAASTVGKTYSIDASITTGGANFNLVSSDPSTDTIKFADGTNMSIVRTDANTITFNATDTTYTQNASSTTGGANLNLVGSDATTDAVKFASGTGITVSRTDANTITITNSDPGSTGVTSITGTPDQVLVSSPTGAVTLSLPQSIATTSNPVFAGVTGGNVTVGVVENNTVATTTGNLIIGDGSQTTNWVVINSAAATPVVIQRFTTGTTGNLRSLALNAQSTGTPTVGFGNQLEFQIEAQPGNTERAGSISVVSTDLTVGSEDFKFSFGLMQNGAAQTEKASLDSAGNLVLEGGITVSGSTSGSSTFNAPATGSTLVYTLPGTDGLNGYVLSTNGSGVLSWIVNPDTNTTYTIDASTTTGGANFNLQGSDATTDTIKFADGSNVTITRTDANTITIAATDTNTTYDFAASTTTGGANLNLTGSDATTDTVKLANGTGVTVSYTSATEVGIAIGQDVATTASPTFAGATLGNITVGVSTDNTITTTTGDLVLASATNIIDATTAAINASTLTVDGRASIDSSTLTTTSTATVALIVTGRDAMTGLVNIIQGANVHCVNFTALRVDATTALLTTYAEMYNTSALATFTADVSGGDLRLLITPTSATSTVFNAVRTSLD